MFEVIVSRVRTGQVDRKQFGTREEAEQYASATEEELLQPKRTRTGWTCPSLNDFRVEVQYRPAVQVAAAARPRLAA